MGETKCGSAWNTPAGVFRTLVTCMTDMPSWLSPSTRMRKFLRAIITGPFGESGIIVADHGNFGACSGFHVAHAIRHVETLLAIVGNGRGRLQRLLILQQSDRR